jgi:adenylate kinase
MHKIVILGPPGSGKGTQAEFLSKALNIPTISTGAIFRDHMARKTDLGKEVDAVMRAGKLVDNEIVNKLVQERLAKDDLQVGYILDGYPRKVEQAQFLSEYRDVSYAIYINSRDTIVMKRLAARRHCDKCGAKFNFVTNPPKVESVCDECGGELVIRADSTAEVISERLASYHFFNDPVVKFYKRRGVLVEINGELSIDDVWQEIKNKLSL